MKFNENREFAKVLKAEDVFRSFAVVHLAENTSVPLLWFQIQDIYL